MVSAPLRFDFRTFGALLEAAPDAMVIVDELGKIVLVNGQTEKWFAYSREELLGQPVEILVPEGARRDHVAHRTRYVADPRLRPMGVGLELYGRRKDGSMFPVEISLSPLRTAAGVLVTAAIRDISDRKEAERVIYELNAQLEERVRELESFSYSVAHDLRTPLRAIAGFATILLEEYAVQLDSEGQRYLKVVRDNVHQMGVFIDALLGLSRLDRYALRKQEMDTAEQVRSCVEAVAAEPYGRRIDVTIGRLPPCVADPSLLKQVWMNLLANAAKFTRKREAAHIEVGAFESGGVCVYYVCDNGAGFDMATARRLFEPFQRFHRAEEYEGTGVGLANVKRIIARHGGRLWADAQVDHGATFFFTLEESPHDHGTRQR